MQRRHRGEPLRSIADHSLNQHAVHRCSHVRLTYKLRGRLRKLIQAHPPRRSNRQQQVDDDRGEVQDGQSAQVPNERLAVALARSTQTPQRKHDKRHDKQMREVDGLRYPFDSQRKPAPVDREPGVSCVRGHCSPCEPSKRRALHHKRIFDGYSSVKQRLNQTQPVVHKPKREQR